MWQAFTQKKIFDDQALIAAVTRWKLMSKKVVFTNGCFDILHKGHIDYLMKAAELGDKLLIGVNTDGSVQRLKGEGRPINDQVSRSEILASLSFVSGVVLFEEETPLELITKVVPDILVKGGDYTPESVVGADVVIANGGRVEIIDLTPGYSTSSIESRILEKSS